MESFYKLNKAKLPFAFTISSLISAIVIVFLLVISAYKDNFPETNLLLIIVLVGVLGFPIFIILIAYLEWLGKTSKIKGILTQYSNLGIDKYPFNQGLINAKTKWYFTNETREILLNDSTLILDPVTRKKVKFVTVLDTRNLDKNQFKKIVKKIQNKNTSVNYYFATIELNLALIKNQTDLLESLNI